MIVIRLLRYWKGYVRFTATGVFLERFLNLAVRRGINIWDVRRRETQLTAYTDVRSYKKLPPYAKKTGIRLRVNERFGAPFEMRRYRKRIGILAGVLFFLLFLWGMGQFIWRIEVTGNEQVQPQTILAAAEELGLKPGVSRKKVDVRELERMLMLKVKELSWVAVNIDGSTATIDVRESIEPPEMYPDDDKACHIVAGRTGLILYMEVYEGQSVKKVGDTVEAGEIIVSGILEDKQGNTSYKHARAKVVAQTEYELTVEQPFSVTEKAYTGEQKHRRYLRLFGVDLPLFIYRPFEVAYDRATETKELSLFGIPLPMALVDETYDFYVQQEQHLNEQEVSLLAGQLLKELEKQQLEGAEIVEKELQREILDNSYKITVKYLCNIDIAKEQQILIN